MSDLCLRAACAAVSAAFVRVVGTGGSFAGNEGSTVRGGAALDDEVAGLGAVDTVVAGFAAGIVPVVVEVAAALGAGVAYAAQMRDEEKLRWDVLYVSGDALGAETESRAATPLCAGVAAIMPVSGWVLDVVF